jgi:hypothetical protein
MRDEIELTCYGYGQMMDYIDKRDYPATASVAEFHERRVANWERLHGRKG